MNMVLGWDAWAAGAVTLMVVLSLRGRERLRAALPALMAAVMRQPDRIRLSPAKDPPWTRAETIAGMTRALAEEGFEDAGAFSIAEMPGVLLRLMTKPQAHLTAVLYEHPRAGAWAELVTHYADGSAATATALPETGVPRPPWLKAFRFPEAAADELASGLERKRPDGEMKPVSAADAPGEFERGYAVHMAWMKDRGLSLGDARRLVEHRVRGGTEKTPYLTAARADVRRAERRRWVAAVCLPVSVISMLGVYAFLSLAHDAWNLRRRGRTATAVVDAARHLKTRGHEAWQVRYHFQSVPGGPSYSARGLFGEEDAWSGIQVPAYAEAEKTRTVEVLYDPVDPRTHALVKAPGLAGITDTPWFFLIGVPPLLILAFFGLVMGLAVL